MNTEFESYSDSGRVSLSRAADGEKTSCNVFRGDDENGGRTTSDIEYGIGYCNNPDIRAAYDGVWIELSTRQRGEDKAHYTMTIEVRLTWKQADRLHDYLGMLLRLAPYRLRGGEEPTGAGR